MNIFILDTDIKKAAEYHCDKHVVKMTTETAQMISINQHLLNGVELPDFIMTMNKKHTHHPCTVWGRQSYENFMWLCNFGLALYNEYQYRYNKPDKHQRAKQIFEWSLKNPPSIPKKGLTPFVKAMSDYPDLLSMSPVRAYRLYYMLDKKRFATWKNRNIPYWFK